MSGVKSTNSKFKGGVQQFKEFKGCAAEPGRSFKWVEFKGVSTL